MTISKLASDVVENHWETKGMKHALQTERDYNLMTSQKLERLKVKLCKFRLLGGGGGEGGAAEDFKVSCFCRFFYSCGILSPDKSLKERGATTSLWLHEWDDVNSVSRSPLLSTLVCRSQQSCS